MSKLFITAIDTDAGKTVITGLLAKYFMNQGINVITQKIAQTGCEKLSEDIEIHRKIMNIPLQDVDKNGETCPFLFKYPASPHLSSRMENCEIDPNKIIKSANKLNEKYELVLMEGVGGLMVPITDNYTVLNFIEDNVLDTILVTTSKLGSINHTLLSLEVLKQRGISVKMLVYNNISKEENPISKDSEMFLCKYLKQNFPNSKFVSVPFIEKDYNISCFNNSKFIL